MITQPRPDAGLDPTRERSNRSAAVVWVDDHHARVAATDPDGRITTGAIERGLAAEAAYLAHVVDAIGDRDRVVILGPGAVRLALEREYVSIYHRPDRLVDVEPAREEVDLLARLRRIAD